MTIKVHYHEVLDLLEELFVFIFNGLRERYAREIDIVRHQYPVEPFKLPEDGKMVRLKFSEGIAMLREAGEQLDEFEDLRFVNIFHLIGLLFFLLLLLLLLSYPFPFPSLFHLVLIVCTSLSPSSCIQADRSIFVF